MRRHSPSGCAEHSGSPAQGLSSSEAAGTDTTCCVFRNSHTVALHYHKADGSHGRSHSYNMAKVSPAPRFNASHDERNEWWRDGGTRGRVGLEWPGCVTEERGSTGAEHRARQ